MTEPAEPAEPEPWLRDPAPGEPGHPDTPFPAPPMPDGAAR
jgi:hypothetical protein